jgi:cyclase
VIRNVAKNVFILLTVGGGIRTTDDMRKILMAGADKISINSSAVKNPDLINEGAEIFGNQCIVVAIDAKRDDVDHTVRDDGVGETHCETDCMGELCEPKYNVYINGGRVRTNLDVIEWAKEVEKRGAGEILLTSMDKDGTKSGFDIELTKRVQEAVNIPIIASGGAGKMSDFKDILEYSDAALAASLFHFNEININDLKSYLEKEGIPVRQL